MEIKTEPNVGQEEGGVEAKTFANLAVGDCITAAVEIVEIKVDQKNEPPQWILYRLSDGVGVIGVFTRNPADLEVGDIVEVEVKVTKEKKPYKGRPQFDYQIRTFKKYSKDDPGYAALTKNLRHEVLLKADLRQLSEGSRVKLITQIHTLYPQNGVREYNLKILLRDVDGQPISLWMKKDFLPLFKEIGEDEKFIVRATVKTVPQKPTIRYLALESLVRGKEVFRDPIFKRYVRDEISYHAQGILTSLMNYQEHTGKTLDSFDVLQLMLKSIGDELGGG